MTLALASVLTLLAGGPQTYDLRLRATGKPVVWNVLEDRVEGKVRTALGTKVQLVASSGGSATLTLGPFTSQGRTFGRPKARSISLTPQATLAGDALGRPPFLLSVPLPGHAVKVGDAWTGAIVGPTPMPAGVKATFRVVGTAKVGGAACAKVTAKIDTVLSGAQITGTGGWTVRLDDGLVQMGSLTTLMVYHRPDQVTHKMTELARVQIKGTIARS
jgi:hypothetical protein